MFFSNNFEQKLNHYHVQHSELMNVTILLCTTENIKVCNATILHQFILVICFQRQLVNWHADT